METYSFANRTYIINSLYGKTIRREIFKKIHKNRKRRKTTFLQITIEDAESWILFLPKPLRYKLFLDILMKYNEF